ncbi:hypothetical protein GALMADRAFT_410001 [Galerina marginata CBS 339.88]|uniref:Uncharacterized protein n=1 Tax=Galerina marginata (strain CBS 339.88) TaxID=685588 RepID=A0A067T3E2_GALM3|nr:hypothetical protein GALMADRAFT_410001 [Galerina marginata CBS 339.88]
MPRSFTTTGGTFLMQIVRCSDLNDFREVGSMHLDSTLASFIFPAFYSANQALIYFVILTTTWENRASITVR